MNSREWVLIAFLYGGICQYHIKVRSKIIEVGNISFCMFLVGHLDSECHARFSHGFLSRGKGARGYIYIYTYIYIPSTPL